MRSFWGRKWIQGRKGFEINEGDFLWFLEEIEIVKDQKDGEDNIDNHSGQNYNVEHFCISTHEIFPWKKK